MMKKSRTEWQRGVAQRLPARGMRGKTSFSPLFHLHSTTHLDFSINGTHTHTRRTMKGRRKTLSFRDVCFCSKVLLRLHCLHFAAPSLPISDRPHPSRRLSSPALPELTNQSGKRLKRPKIGLFTEPRIKFHDGPLTQLPTTLPRLSLLPTFRLESFLHPT